MEWADDGYNTRSMGSSESETAPDTSHLPEETVSIGSLPEHVRTDIETIKTCFARSSHSIETLKLLLNTAQAHTEGNNALKNMQVLADVSARLVVTCDALTEELEKQKKETEYLKRLLGKKGKSQGKSIAGAINRMKKK